MKELRPIILISIVAIVIAFLAMAFFLGIPGCMTAPERSNYNSNECFQASDCMWYNRDNKDKSSCAKYHEDCSNYNASERKKQILKYCAEQTPKTWSERECQTYLERR